MPKRPRGGFTLIELLVVTVILGVLAAIAVAKFDFTKKRGYRAAVRSDLKNLAVHQEMYMADYFIYASNASAAGFEGSEGVVIAINEASGRGWAATATHPGLPGEQCGFFFGEAASSNASPAVVQGMAACTN